MKRVDHETFPFPGLYGWMAVAAVVVAFDEWAHLTGRATMSRTLGHFLSRPVIGPILAGAWTALCYHLLVEERLDALDKALIASPSLPDITSAPSIPND